MSTYKRFAILYSIFLLIVILEVKVASAFTDMSIEKLDKAIQKIVQQKNQGNKNAGLQFQKIFNILSAIDTKKHTQDEIIAELQHFIKEGKIPIYIFNSKRQYKYAENNNVLYIVGTNIRLRSQPNMQARIITTLNTETTDYLTYLGEWKNSEGERWVLAMNSLNNRTSKELGWIYGKYTRLVPNIRIQSLISKYKSSANDINIISETTPHKESAIDKIVKPQNNKKSDNSIDINWNYVFWGLLIVGVVYVITSATLEWEFNLENFFIFLVYTFCALAAIAIVCVVIKVIWEKIILPILAGIVLLFGLTGDDGISKNSGTSNNKCCEYPNREYCSTCPMINFSDESQYFSGYYKCRDHNAYVNPDYNAEYNSENLKYG